MNNTKDSSAIFGVDNVSEKVANTLVSEELHIPAGSEHLFRKHLNTCSGII